MKHYKAISEIHKIITEKECEITRLRNIKTESDGYAGYVFIQNDIENIKNDINDLTETMSYLIKDNEI